MKNKKYNIEITGYRYAPESIKVFNHGKQIYINSTLQQMICCNIEKAMIEIKKEIRRQQNKKEKYTIVFETDNNRLLYFHFNKFNRYDIEKKLEAYKQLKSRMIENNWKHESYVVEKGMLFDNNAEKNVIYENVYKRARILRIV